MNRRLLKHPKLITLSSLLVIDYLFFSYTNPQRVSTWLLMAGFGLLFITFYMVLRAVFSIMNWYGLSFSKQHKRRAKALAAVCAVLVALQSIGQLATRDIIVMLPLAAMLYMYTSYNRPAAKATVAAETSPALEAIQRYRSNY